MKANAKLYASIATAILFAPAAEAARKKIPVQEPWDQIERSKAAEIRAEIMGPTMTRAETAKVAALLGVRKQRADRELVAYEQFRMDRQLALAEASAPRPRTVINNYMGTPGRDQPTGMGVAQSRGVRRVAYSLAATPQQPDRAFLSAEPGPPRQKTYPARFYRRASQEESVDKQAAALTAQSLLEGLAPPFGQPVPGMPGYVTGPAPSSKGVIDVRGLSPGMEVRDPYTGEHMRVP